MALVVVVERVRVEESDLLRRKHHPCVGVEGAEIDG
jgi:hypothetical protein